MATAANGTREVELRRRPAIVAALALCFALGTARVGYGQPQESSLWFTRVAYAPAYVFATNPFSLSGAGSELVRSTPSMTIEIGRQTDGSREWHHMYGLPAYGFGLSVASLGNGDRISRPMEAYTFFSWPFARPSERVHLTTDFGMGLSWNWKAFNRQTNSFTTVLGSDVNARIDWGFYLRFIATPQTSVYAGLDYTHRSNGGMRHPDLGINVIGPSVGLRYNLTPEHYQRPVKQLPRFRPVWEFVIGGTGGLKKVVDTRSPDRQRDIGVLGAAAGVQRHFYRFGKIAAGTEVAYDGAAMARVDRVTGSDIGRSDGAPSDRLAVGIYSGYEHVIGRFGPFVQLGYGLANGPTDQSRPRLYQRYGWRYHFSDRYWGTFAVRAINGRKADFLEFGIGYRLRR